MNRLLTLGIIFMLLVSSCSRQLPDEIQTAYQRLPEKIDFNFHVKPILSDKCFTCHGPDEESLQAGLRLDLPASSLERKESGEIPIVPGSAVRSHLVERILSEDADWMMPPAESHLSLTKMEMATLIKWIDQGAEYKPHWSFIKPEKGVLPEVQETGWPKNEIDYFVLKNLEESGYQPSPQAEAETLIRRLYFNLTGLPPSIEATESFLADHSPEMYEKLVDQLLASPAYGERMAMDWMDVARYADSDGYLDDKHRDFSPWRDWVIEAFNENMPYDQFVSWQLAGDLIPEATQESILATAFNRLHRRNSEAGIVFEEYRTEYVADRTNTLGKAFLGLSVECARCHDHKYDPVSQEDYYRMFAFFNSTNEFGTAIYGPDQTPGPALLLSEPEQQEILDYLDDKIRKQEAQLLRLTSGTDKDYQTWVQDQQQILSSLQNSISKDLIVHYPFDQFITDKDPDSYTSPDVNGRAPAEIKEPEIQPGSNGKAVFLTDFTRISLPEKIGWFDRVDPFTISLEIFPDTLYQEAGIFFHCEDLRLGLKGYSLYLQDNQLRFIISHSWPQNSLQVTTRQPLAVKDWSQITITYDGSSKAEGIRVFLNGKEIQLDVDQDHLYKGITYQPDIHTYGFSGFTLGARDKMKIFKGGGLDELKIYRRKLSALEVLYQYQRDGIAEVLNDLDKNAPMLLEFYSDHFNPSVTSLRKSLYSDRTELNQKINEIPEIMVLGDLPEPRPTHVLNRGLYSAPGASVEVGTPSAVLAFDQELPRNRLGLAQWLFESDHPLTSRVFVNRIWQMHFGKGIVTTSDDFGNQGAIPSHPELLDWLAVTFMESGWDIKQLHKSIVMSSTFQQSSRLNPEMLEADPENVLLSRGPSYRMKSEMIRDNALAISGLLVDKIGGPSVYPYQPEGLWDEISNKIWRYKYLQQPGEGLYRRSLYTIWKRSSPPPSMLVFDAPGRDVCRVRRANTSTPLQALVLLNDPQYLEAARVMAEKILTEKTGQPLEQLTLAFKQAIGRQPDVQELEILSKFYLEEMERFSDNKLAVQSYLTMGEMPLANQAEPIELAALATVVHSILNTNESYTLR